MDRSFILPISIAAALHAAALFGIPRGPVPNTMNKVADTVLRFVITPQVDPPDVEVVVTDSAPKGQRDQIVPVSAEEAPPRPGFTIDIPKIPATTPTPGLKQLGPIQIGVPDGIGTDAWASAVASVRLDNPPRTRAQVPPVFPAEARQRGESGRVVVEFIVDETGHVLQPRIVESTSRVFEEATLRAISRWRFEPGRRDGRVVRFRMALPVEFNLNDSI